MTALPGPYVRTEMLPQQPPPIGQAGLLRWVRENLFSSVLNATLTLSRFWSCSL